MSAVREKYTNIVGVDTHARTNTYAILVAATGSLVDTATFPTSGPGLKRAIAWIDRRSEPGRTLVAIEGTNSYGAGLTRALRTTELDLCEVRPPRRTSRAGRGKSDDIDALAAARTVLGDQVEALLDPRAEGNREALRILLNARTVMERQGTADRLMLTSMLRTMDLGVDARHALTDEQVLMVSRWHARRDDDLSIRIARAEATRLATAIRPFHAQLVSNHQQLQEVVGLMAAGLLDLYGIGPRQFSNESHPAGVPRDGQSSIRPPCEPDWPPWVGRTSDEKDTASKQVRNRSSHARPMWVKSGSQPQACHYPLEKQLG
ncbi:IS110 family transposase [Paeniglutamicibacter psychrophenolicus]|uniref:IS110 family transposase n=1 Tax=Paeniglutamicibacter psychrophenolicus TaxID=257454 RepID=UPI00278A1D55|nr:transposase [Paeniglutamicibacter psychrophenolicus]MDQ0093056.1 hypothetical protein [Paeniglutamicibacter psychrophenolicus]